MALNLTKRRFWQAVPGPSAILCGDMVLRYSVSETLLDAAAIDGVHAPAGRLVGATSFDKIGNLVPWSGRDADDRPVVMFGKMAASATPTSITLTYPTFGDTVLNVPEFTLANAWATISNGAFRPGVFSAARWVGAMNLNCTPRAQGGTSASVSSMLKVDMALLHAKQRGTTVTVASFTPTEDGYDDGNAMATGFSDFTVIGGAGTGGSVGTIYHEQSVKSAIGPDAAMVRSLMSLPKTLPAGHYRRPFGVATAHLAAGGYVHGFHPNIRAVVLETNVGPAGLPVAEWIHAVFTPAEVAAILAEQKKIVSAADAVQLESLRQSVLATDGWFNLLLSPTNVGPVDIYTAQAIAKARSDGADIADIDKYVVSGKKLSEWRSICNAQKSTRALLWVGERLNRGLVPIEELNFDVTSGLYAITKPIDVSTDVQYSLDAAVIADAYARAIEALTAPPPLAPSLDFDAAITQLEQSEGVDIVNTAQATEFRGVVSTMAGEPWRDLGMVWLQRCAMKTAQPLANCLAAAITEPLSAFTV